MRSDTLPSKSVASVFLATHPWSILTAVSFLIIVLADALDVIKERPVVIGLTYFFSLLFLLLAFLSARKKGHTFIFIATTIIFSFLAVAVNRYISAPAFSWRFDRNAYIHRVEANPQESFQVFPKSQDFAFPAGGAWEYIVYDLRDQMMKPEKSRDADWQAKHGGYLTPPTPTCSIEVEKLETHFYYLQETC